MAGIGGDTANSRRHLTACAGTRISVAILAVTVVLWQGPTAWAVYLGDPLGLPDIGDWPDVPVVVYLPVPNKDKQRNKDSRILQNLRETQAEIEVLLAEDPEVDLSILSVPSYRYVTDDGDIQVYVHIDDFKKHLMDKLEAGGLLVELISERTSVVQGWVSYEDLDSLSRVPCVSKLTLPGYGVTNETSVVPEPTTLAVLIAGGLFALRRSRQRRMN